MIPGVTESIVTGSFSIFGAGLISIPLYWHLEGEHPCFIFRNEQDS